MRRWFINVLLGLDQLGNALTGGYPDETISSRSARAAKKGKWLGRFMCWWLDKLDGGHCGDALKHERDGKHQHPDIR